MSATKTTMSSTNNIDNSNNSRNDMDMTTITITLYENIYLIPLKTLLYPFITKEKMSELVRIKSYTSYTPLILKQRKTMVQAEEDDDPMMMESN